MRKKEIARKFLPILVAACFAASVFSACKPNGPDGAGADKTALQTLYGEVKDTERNGYGAEPWTAFVAALNAAAAVLDDAGATQQEIDAARGALLAAFNALAPSEPEGVITTAAQLAAIQLDGDYVLGADLTLTGFTPLGSGAEPFTGTLDGGGHKITSLTVNLADLTAETDEAGQNACVYAGLFAVNNGAVANLTVENLGVAGTCAVSGATVYVGGLSGLNGGVIQNCRVSGAMNLNAGGSDAKYRGGLIAAKNSGLIGGCAAAGKIDAESTSGNARFGGIVGINEGGTVVLCAAEVDIDAYSQLENIRAGGLAGQLSDGDSVIDRCYAGGGVTAVAAGETVYAGGLIGYLDATNDVAQPNARITDSYSVGAVYVGGGGNGYAGGLIARIENAGYVCEEITVKNCYSAGTVTLDVTGGNRFAAGLAGRVQRHNASSFVAVDNCFTVSDISAAAGAATAVIKNGNAANSNTPCTVSDCFYSSALTCPQDAFKADATAVSPAGLASPSWQQSNLFWDFTAIWLTQADGFPSLRGLPI
ncbi:MAG: hypothetical protein LBL66_07940 [Clostridiales bacterium]|nr:hypothetical protein [Clostridiales bacterium]